ncbi:MAG: bifunctional diaminohydroxyphosphoribosylaminopyrimidine deaminase/5-amino-6-(5-phosphoribosylamino)uracil reductase RibD [bacterium]|nr:bifunctional diaminohydroxyphosphoribosylaminopyrimidine deaminase/5-amino-6-(5-phosphoribosylamino)uracil reductase RibD [bacterium]
MRYNDETLMRRAFVLARGGYSFVGHNPQVGAIVVGNNGRLYGGAHQRFGEAHAEVNAIRAAGSAASGGDLYVTLEPCNHWGKTPPCSHFIAEAGIKRVVVAMRDPNPQAGGGIEFLREQGISVIEGVLAVEARNFYHPWVVSFSQKRPYLVLKLALTLDGCLAREHGQRSSISGPVAKAWVQRLRAQMGAVLLGGRTVEVDDPLIAVPEVLGPEPLVAIAAGGNRLDLANLQIFSGARRGPVRLYTVDGSFDASADGVKHFERRLVEACADGCSIVALLDDLYNSNIRLVMAEAGPKLALSLLQRGLVDELLILSCTSIAGKDAVGLGDGDAESLAGVNLELKRFRPCGARVMGRDILNIWRRIESV